MSVGRVGIFRQLGESRSRKQDCKYSHSNNFVSFGLQLAGSQFPDQGLSSSQGSESPGS